MAFSELPQAQHRFKTDGISLLADIDQLEDVGGDETLVNVNQRGQSVTPTPTLTPAP